MGAWGAHERSYIEHLETAGYDVARVDGRDGDGAMPVDQTIEAMRAGRQIIVQGALAHGRWSGRTDVLKRVDGASALGDWSYEVIDTKLAARQRAGRSCSCAFTPTWWPRCRAGFPSRCRS